VAKTSKETKDKWLKEDKYWKWGIFYYNPEDKRILPRKRISWMGWTINFANKKSIVVFIIIMVITLSMITFLPIINTVFKPNS
jgi:uncharacterized membrane protein